MSQFSWPELVKQLDVSAAVRAVALLLTEEPNIRPRYSLLYVKPQDAVAVSPKFKQELGRALRDYFDCPVLLEIRMWLAGRVVH